MFLSNAPVYMEIAPGICSCLNDEADRASIKTTSAVLSESRSANALALTWLLDSTAGALIVASIPTARSTPSSLRYSISKFKPGLINEKSSTPVRIVSSLKLDYGGPAACSQLQHRSFERNGIKCSV